MSELAREQLLVGVKDHLDAALSLFEDDGQSVQDVDLLEQQLAVAHKYAARARNARSVADGDLPEDVLNVISSGLEHDEPLDDEDAVAADATGDQRTEEVSTNQDSRELAQEGEGVKEKQAEQDAEKDLRKEDAKSNKKGE